MADFVTTRGILIALIAGLLGTEGSPSYVAIAQESMPVATPATDPANCASEPRPTEDFRFLPEEQSQQLGTLVATPPLPSDGVPADAGIVSASTATTEESLPCINAGDLLKIAAFVTDDYVARSATGPGLDVSAEWLANLFRPRPAPVDLRVRLFAIAELQMLPSGQVSAVVATRQGTTSLLSVEAHGQNRIDGSLPAPATGTPSP